MKARLRITPADLKRFERLELSIAVERLERASIFWWNRLNDLDGWNKYIPAPRKVRQSRQGRRRPRTRHGQPPYGPQALRGRPPPGRHRRRARRPSRADKSPGPPVVPIVFSGKRICQGQEMVFLTGQLQRLEPDDGLATMCRVEDWRGIPKVKPIC